jgi:hypothetical protein
VTRSCTTISHNSKSRRVRVVRIKDTLHENSTLYIDLLLAPLIDARIPFSCTYGNHDNQANISHLAEMEREVKVAPLSYSRRSPLGVGGVGGEANYWVPVYADKKGEHYDCWLKSRVKYADPQ